MINRAKPALLPIAAIVLFALATDAQANQISATPTSDRPTMESTEAGAGGRPEADTQPAPVASASAISSAVQESRVQAMTRHNQSGDGAENGIVAESTATAQGIWQIQIASCTAHCRRVSQVQNAKQRNRTVQTFGGSRRLTGAERRLLRDDRSKTNTGLAPTAQTSTGHIPRSKTHTGLVPIARTSTGITTIAKSGLTESGKRDLTQIRLGCISHCFGTTARTSQLPPQAHQPTLKQLLDTIAAAIRTLLHDVPAAEQNRVAQTSRQWQYGNGLGAGQTQTASQVSSTVQSNDVLPTGAARSAFGDHVPQLVNQTEQGIWQLQVGCLAFCSQTRQVQRAEQSNTTMRSAGTGGGSSSHPPTSSVNVTTQTVWQVQVGCLMWCFDTEQQQTASSENSEGELPGRGAAAGTPPPAGTKTPTSSMPGNSCDHAPTPRRCNLVVSLGGAWPRATGGTTGPSPRPASGTRRRAGRDGEVRWDRRGNMRPHRDSAAPSEPARRGRGRGDLPAGSCANTRNSAAQRAGFWSLRQRVSAGLPGLAIARSWDELRSWERPRSTSYGAQAAIALCALDAARAFGSEPIPRRGATEK